jgi:hypothetical protein
MHADKLAFPDFQVEVLATEINADLHGASLEQQATWDHSTPWPTSPVKSAVPESVFMRSFGT